MNRDKVLCKCRNVTKGDILSAMQKGASKYKEVSKITGVGTKCGHCEDKIRHFIKKHRQEAGAGTPLEGATGGTGQPDVRDDD